MQTGDVWTSELGESLEIQIPAITLDMVGNKASVEGRVWLDEEQSSPWPLDWECPSVDPDLGDFCPPDALPAATCSACLQISNLCKRLLSIRGVNDVLLSKGFLKIQFIFHPHTKYTKTGRQRENRRAGVLVFSHTKICHQVPIEFQFCRFACHLPIRERRRCPQSSCPSSPISSFHPEGPVNKSHRKMGKEQGGSCGYAQEQ